MAGYAMSDRRGWASGRSWARQGSYLDSGVTARLGLGHTGVTAGITNLADVRGNRFALGTPFTTGREGDAAAAAHASDRTGRRLLISGA